MKKTLNIGSGERTYDEYPEGYICLNMDEREELEKVDIVGDITNLSRFSEGEFDYLLASDILEHFPFVNTAELLREWSRVLKIGGVLELRVPDFEAIVDHYNKHKNMQHVSWMIMGGQDYPGNYHFIVFDETWLRIICEHVGFTFISCKKETPNIVMKVKKP